MPPIDAYFSSQTKAHRNRRSRKHSEEELEECRSLLKLPGKELMSAYNATKQLLYTRATVSPGYQLFVDLIDKAIKRASRRWGKIEVLKEEIARIKV